MESIDQEVWGRVREWLSEGRPTMLGTVTRTWGSAPRPVGALVAIRHDGQIVGSVSGGCVEDDLIERCQQLLAGPPLPSVVHYGVSRDQAARFGLPCGGSLQIVLQPLRMADQAAWIDTLAALVAQRRCVQREVDMATGTVRLQPIAPEADLEPHFDGQTLRAVHGPRWRLLLIGAGQLGRCVAEMALALDYDVVVCDPRHEYADAWRVAGVQVEHSYPDDFIVAHRPDRRTAVVTLTHDPKLDDAALIEALQSPAFYVGALGSRRNSQTRRERLALFELSTDQIGALHAPVGLAIGSRTPPEIAVSILAEITAARRGATYLPPRLAGVAADKHAAPAKAPADAV